MKKREFILLILALILGFSPVQAITFQTITGGSIQERDEVSLLSDDQLFVYDKEQAKFINIVNLNNPSKLRIVIMDTGLGVQQIFRPPNTSKFQAFTIESIDFYPTEITADKRRNNGFIVIKTNKGFITIDLVTHESMAFRFTQNFFEGRHGEIPFFEINKARSPLR